MDYYISEGDVWKKNGTTIQVIGRIPLPEDHKEILVQNIRTGLISEMDEDSFYLDEWDLVKGGVLDLSNMHWRVVSENGTTAKTTIEVNGRGVSLLDYFNFELVEGNQFPTLTLKFPIKGGLELSSEKFASFHDKHKIKKEETQ